MVPRECDNDDCDYNDCGRWEHVEGCEPMPMLTEQELKQLREKGVLEEAADTLLGALVRGGMLG